MLATFIPGTQTFTFGSFGGSDSDSGEDENAMLIFTFASGTRPLPYLVRVSGKENATGTYRITVRHLGASEPDGHDFASNAGTDGYIVGRPVTGNISTDSDKDWFAVELEAGKRYQFDLEGADTGRGTLGEGPETSRGDPYLVLHDASGDVIAQAYDGGVGLNSRIIYTPTASGTYYLDAADGYLAFTGTYTLPAIELGARGVSEADTDLPADNTTTGRVEVGASATGTVGATGGRDWFAVDLEVGKTYQFDVEGLDTGRGTLPDTYLVLYDASGREVAFHDDGGEGDNSRITYTPTETGIYYANVDTGDGTTGTYTPSVRDVPPPPESGYEEGGTDLPADTTTPGQVQVDEFGAGGNIESARDYGWFAVELEAGRTYRIDLQGGYLIGAGTFYDPDITLISPDLVGIYDASGNWISGTSDSEESGTDHSTGTYELRVTDITEDPDQHAAHSGTTGTVAVGGSATGKVDSWGDHDWFKVTLEARQAYRFDLEGQATGRGSLRDPYLHGVYDANGVLISPTLDDDGGVGNNARLTFTPERDGTYYVAAGAFGHGEGTYTLLVTEVTAPSQMRAASGPPTPFKALVWEASSSPVPLEPLAGDAPEKDGGAVVLDFAHFANGDGIISDLVIVNVGSQPIRRAIYFYDTEGNLIDPELLVDITGDLEVTEDGSLSVLTEMEPLGELTISTHGRGALVSGSVKVVSDGPIGGMLRFDLPAIGEAVVGASPPISDAVFPVHRQAGGINTVVAIRNLESTAGLVRCELMREGVLQDVSMIPLAANGQTSWTIDTAFPSTDLSDFAGSVRCTAVEMGRFTAVALEMDPDNRISTTMPVVPVEERRFQE